MKKHLFFAIVMLVSTSMFFISCSKDDEKNPPSLAFKSATGYVVADATADFNDTILVGIQAAFNGSDNITKLTISANDQVILDSAVNVLQLSVDFTIIKGAQASETWKFSVTDAANKETVKTIVLSRPGTEINTYSSVILGAQESTTEPNFLSASTGTRYSVDEAFINQEKIDIFCFYENTASHQNLTTLASPGSNITGIYTGNTSPENYTVKNVTFFMKTTLTTAQFDAISNDEIILQSFDPENAFKKAKNLQSGEVYAMKTQAGKYGLFKVGLVTPETNGSVEIDLKIQK